MAKTVTLQHKSVKTIKAKGLIQMMQAKSHDFILIDARSADEQRTSMLPGAIPKELFNKHRKNFKNRLIIAYCTIGSRSSKLVTVLDKKGFKAVSLEGGVLSWAHAGGKFINGAKDTKKVKFLNDAWDLLPEKYEGVFL